MTNNKPPIQVGVAGLGRSGWGIHAATLKHVPDLFGLAAVCDADPERQQEAYDAFECRTYTNVSELIADSDIEFVVVATPSHQHAEHAIAAMRAGKDVMVEKPMATSLADVDRMLAVARETGRILTVNQNYRYAADFVKIKEVIDSGVLGRIIQIRIAAHQFRRRWDWQTLKQYGGGILNNHGAHYVDCAMLLLDDAEPDIFCHMETLPLCTGDAESHVKLILKPEHGPLVDIELTHACAYPQEQYLVMGTQGTLSSQRATIRWSYYDPASVPPLELDTKPTPDRSYNSEVLPMHEEVFEPELDFIGSSKQLYKDLYAALRQEAPLAITPQSVRNQIAVLEKCRALSPVYGEENV